MNMLCFFFFQAEDGIRDGRVTGVQTCALPISAHPGAAYELLVAVSRATGLLLPTADLRTAAELARADVDKQVAQSEEAVALVRALEEQYDAYVRNRPGTDLLAQAGPLPSADELGAELERFLAERNKPGDPPLG